MYFDGVVNVHENRIRGILISPIGAHVSMAIKLSFLCANNMAEYEAGVAGLEAILVMNVKDLVVYGGSILIISHSIGEWRVKSLELPKYKGF